MTAQDEDPVREALRAALAGEHAAVYAYTVIAGRLAGESPEVARAVEDYRAHRAQRDMLAAMLRALGDEPPPAEPGYALPRPVEGPPSASALARRVEDRCAVLHADLVATTTGDARAAGVTGLVDCATRAVRWDAPPTAFPGVGAA